MNHTNYQVGTDYLSKSPNPLSRKARRNKRHTLFANTNANPSKTNSRQSMHQVSDMDHPEFK